MRPSLRLPGLIMATLLACATRGPDAGAAPNSGSAPAGTKGLVHVSSTGQQEVFPVRVLSIGISDFPKLGAQDDLRSGESDARWFVDQLKQVLSIDYPRVIVGQEATKANIEAEIQKVVGGAGPNEVVLLYFATQAAQVGRKGYLFTYDTDPEGKTQYTALPTETIASAIKSSKAKQVVVLADAVHENIQSGSGFKSGQKSEVGSLLGAISSARKNVLVIPGGQVAPRPDDPCAGHSVFACSVIAALQGRADLNNDGYSELAEIVSTVPGAIASSAQSGSGERRSEPVGDVGTSMGIPVIQTVKNDAPNPVVDATWSDVKLSDIRICYLGNGEIVPVNHVFKSGDIFAVRVTAPETGQLAMLNVGPDGAVHPLFPWQGEDPRIYGGTAKQVMPSDAADPIAFDNTTGKEKVYVLWRPESYGAFDQATLMRVAEERGRMSAVADAGAPDNAWKAGTKGLTHLSQVSGVSNAGATISPVSTAGSSNASTAGLQDGCNVYKPQKYGEGWVVELTLDHQ